MLRLLALLAFFICVTASAQVTALRHFFVTNANDEGSGSLRQALLDAQSQCRDSQCTIAFRIPVPAPIRPLTPLPDITSLLEIDGATQTAFTGDTIEIDGGLLDRALLTGGHGLHIRNGCGAVVTDLTIRGFPVSAVHGAGEMLLS